MASTLVMMQVNAVIDQRTTTICLHANGLMAEPGEPFETIAGLFYHPPFHRHCRSVIRPWQPGYISKARAEANAELQRRPMKQRRLGPGGPGQKPAPPDPANPPAPRTPSPAAAARDARVQQKLAELQKLLAKLQAPVDLTRADLRAARKSWDESVLNALSQEQRARYEAYIGSGYLSVNSALRNAGEGMSAAVARRIEVMDSLFDNGLVMGQPIHLWRGIVERDGFAADRMLAGSEVVEYGYASTTVSNDVAKGFAWLPGEKGWVIRIRVPAGTRMVPGEVSEHELILRRGTRYLVLERDEAAGTMVWEVIP